LVLRFGGLGFRV
jgi:hypothetical protein